MPKKFEIVVAIFLVLFLLLGSNLIPAQEKEKPPIDEDDLKSSESNKLPSRIFNIHDTEHNVHYLTINKVQLDRTETNCYIMVEYAGETVDTVKVIKTTMQCN